MASGAEQTPVPPQSHEASFWSANRRRPAFLIILVTGLILFIIYLPSGTRTSLWTGLIAQQGLVVLLCLFALLTLSLIWSAGQRLDTRAFMLFNMRGYPQWLDRFMWLVTQLGNMLTAFIAAFLLFVLNYRRLAIVIIFGTLTLWLKLSRRYLTGIVHFFLLIRHASSAGRKKAIRFPVVIQPRYFS
jgi:hypothetical protein